MDETEVQVEIACWAQDHPEASTINWKNGNEPWVNFSGKRGCIVLVGLGGLTWSIRVPSGYHSAVDPGDGKRKRIWEPLDYLDTVIVQSSSTPFHVSVVDHANNILDLSTGLEQEFADKASMLVANGGSGDVAAQQQNVHDSLVRLQVKCEEEQNEESLIHRSNRTSAKEMKRSLIISDACLAALKEAETLAEVLDAIHGLAKVYNKHLCSDPPHQNTDFYGLGIDDDDDDDEHLFEPEMAIKWSCIVAQVNYARDVCVAAAIALDCPTQSEADSRSPPNKKSLDMFATSSSSSSGSRIEGDSQILKLQSSLTLIFPSERIAAADQSDSEEEYTFVSPGSSSCTPQDIGEDFKKLQTKDDDDPILRPYDSDSDKSDSSWELASLLDHGADSKPREPIVTGNREDRIAETAEDSTLEGAAAVSPGSSSSSKHKRKYSAASIGLSHLSLDEPTTKKTSAEYAASDVNQLGGIIAETELSESGRDFKGLQWCDIAFNPASFSVECTIYLSKFMDNPEAATALGFAVEHPLRLEIVPNKVQVDSLAWTGAVEVYVSQQSDWHNHISEEICGLLCLVPNIVQSYFNDYAPILISDRKRLNGEGPEGNLFVGVLETIVRRLVNINAGGSYCCICEMPCWPPSLLYMKGRNLWPCSDSLCQATYATWQEVSSVDAQERERDENSGLHAMEKKLRDDFPFDDEEALKFALNVYSVSSDQMSYGKRIRALARIELWNQKDPNTAISDALFEFPT